LSPIKRQRRPDNAASESPKRAAWPALADEPSRDRHPGCQFL
jgi:hypothetical protein